jgi:hypothetical protein
MNIKQFLKPDWRKILIFIIFIFSSYIVYIFSFVTISSALSTEGYNEMVKKGIKVTCIEGYPSCSWSEFRPTIFTYIFVPLSIIIIDYGWFLNLIFCYPVSCLIVWIYDKFRKGK